MLKKHNLHIVNRYKKTETEVKQVVGNQFYFFPQILLPPPHFIFLRFNFTTNC